MGAFSPISVLQIFVFSALKSMNGFSFIGNNTFSETQNLKMHIRDLGEELITRIAFMMGIILPSEATIRNLLGVQISFKAILYALLKHSCKK